MAVKPLAGDFGLVLSVVVLFSLMSLISCSSRSFNTQESEVFAEVVGAAECLDCDEKTIKQEHAFKGLQVAIKCKTINKLQESNYEIKATSELNPKGEFTVKLPADLIGHSNDLTTKCFAQLHDASNTPCPHQTPSNIILLQSKLNSNKLTYSTSTSKLSFSSSTCTSAFRLLRKFFHHHHHAYKSPNPSPSPTPVYEPTPPSPVYKPTPPSPVYEPTPPSPVYEPTPPVYKKPIYVPKYPPVYKKPLPPVPEYHPHPKYQIPPSHGWPPLPPFPKYHPHPKYQIPPSHGWPPLPPFSSHHPKHPYFPPSKEVVLPSP